MNIKEESATLINFFANKELSFDKSRLKKEMMRYKWRSELMQAGIIVVRDIQNNIIGHPVMIGDVLEKSKLRNFKGYKRANLISNILAYWEDEGFTKSLNEIFEGEIVHHFCSGKKYPCNGICKKENEFFKDKNTQALFLFLRDLISNQKQS